MKWLIFANSFTRKKMRADATKQVPSLLILIFKSVSTTHVLTILDLAENSGLYSVFALRAWMRAHVMYSYYVLVYRPINTVDTQPT